MGVRSHSGLRSTCLLIQSRTQQLSAANCRLYSLLPPPGAGLGPEGEGDVEGAEPLVCLAALSSSVVAEGLTEAGPLKVNPGGGERESKQASSPSRCTQSTANRKPGLTWRCGREATQWWSAAVPVDQAAEALQGGRRAKPREGSAPGGTVPRRI